MTLVRFRVDLPGGHSIGPGKIRLLELLEEHGSISAAARAMRISYRQAWMLLKDLNESLGEPLFETATGGRKGGGARLTPLGRKVVERYRVLAGAIEAVARRTLRGLLGHSASRSGRRP
jgi:molybdate transport system regulatory protein